MSMLELDKIYNMDCIEGMKQIDDNSIDLVLTDPPYGINYKSNYSGSKKYKKRIHSHNWDSNNFNFSYYFSYLWDKLKDNSHMYVFGTWKHYELMINLGCKQVLIWDKGTPSLGDLKSWGIGYELIYFFEKGKRPVNKRICPVLRVEPLSSWSNGNPIDNYKHPTQKPIELIDILVNISSNVDETIFDPFMGSGTTAVSCKRLNRHFIGFEISKEYCDIANKRLTNIPDRLENWIDIN